MEQSSSFVQHQPFSSTCCVKNSSLISSTAINMSSNVPASSSTAKIPIKSKSPGILTGTGKPVSMRRNSKSDAASSSHVKLLDTCRNKRRIRYCGSFRIWNLELSWRGSNGETRCLQNSYRETWSIQQIRKLGKSQSWQTEMATQSPQCLTRMQSSRS